MAIHSLAYAESIGYVGNSRQALGSLGTVGSFLFNELFNASWTKMGHLPFKLLNFAIGCWPCSVFAPSK